MSTKYEAAMTRYYAQFGLRYTGSYGKRGETTQVAWGPYRGCSLYVVGEYRHIGSSTDLSGQTPNVSHDYARFLRVGIRITPVKSLAVFPRAEYKNGRSPIGDSDYSEGNDLLHAKRLVVGTTPRTGIPEFDANLVAVTNDERLDGTVLTPELARWLAADRRSYGPRIMFHDQDASLCFHGDVDDGTSDMFAPTWIFPAADHLIDILSNVPEPVRPIPFQPEAEYFPAWAGAERAAPTELAEEFDPAVTEPEITDHTRYWSGLGFRYTAQQTGRGQSLQDTTGPYRGHTLRAIGERLLIDHVESEENGTIVRRAVYRNFLQVRLMTRRAKESGDIIIFDRTDHRTGSPPWTDNKYLYSLDIHAEKVVAVLLRETGVPEFDSRFAVLGSVKDASELLRPDVATWIARDPRSADGRTVLLDGFIGRCSMSGKGPDAEDLFTPDHVFRAADYLLDLLATIPPALISALPHTP